MLKGFYTLLYTFCALLQYFLEILQWTLCRVFSFTVSIVIHVSGTAENGMLSVALTVGQLDTQWHKLTIFILAFQKEEISIYFLTQLISGISFSLEAQSFLFLISVTLCQWLCRCKTLELSRLENLTDILSINESFFSDFSRDAPLQNQYGCSMKPRNYMKS